MVNHVFMVDEGIPLTMRIEQWWGAPEKHNPQYRKMGKREITEEERKAEILDI
jgi:hypothetical protein